MRFQSFLAVTLAALTTSVLAGDFVQHHKQIERRAVSSKC